MINLFRKNQRVLMLCVTILTIAAFIWLYNRTNIEDLSAGRVATVYGRPFTQSEVDKELKTFQLSMGLGQFELLSALGGTAASQEAAANDFVWNLLVLRHQAEKMGVAPTQDQIMARETSLPVFQTDGQFDPRKQAKFVQEQLSPRGLTVSHLESVMRDSIQLDTLKELVTSTVAISDSELRYAARGLRSVTAEYVLFDLGAAIKAAKVTPEEIEGYYERNKQQILVPESRSVRYVAFSLPPASASAEGKERVNALQIVAERAMKFAESVAAPGTDFSGAAGTAGLTVQTTPEIDNRGNVTSVGGEKSFADSKELFAALARSAFVLEKEGVTSDVIQNGDDFFVIQLAKVLPSRVRTLAEATPQIEASIREQKGAMEMRTAADSAIEKIRAALAEGKSFKDAAKSAGLTVGNLNAFTPFKPPENVTEDQRHIAAATMLLNDKQASGFERAPWGGFMVYLDARAPMDEAVFAENETEYREQLLERKKNLMFVQWLKSGQKDANIVMAGNNRR